MYRDLLSYYEIAHMSFYKDFSFESFLALILQIRMPSKNSHFVRFISTGNRSSAFVTGKKLGGERNGEERC